MPKILVNIKETLLAEAKRQVMEQGYSAMTIRSVASACGVGVGTVYNYFSSKDMLVASFMLEDWMLCKGAIDAGCKADRTVEEALYCIYDELKTFTRKYETLFHDESAEMTFASTSRQHHKSLCEQIATPLLPFCQRQTRVDAEFLAMFIADNMLMWSRTEHSFAEVSSVLLQLF